MLVYKEGHNEVSPVLVPVTFCSGPPGGYSHPTSLSTALAEGGLQVQVEARSAPQVLRGQGREERISFSSGLQEPFPKVRPSTL